MQSLDVSGAVRPIYVSLGVKRLMFELEINKISLISQLYSGVTVDCRDI